MPKAMEINEMPESPQVNEAKQTFINTIQQYIADVKKKISLQPGFFGLRSSPNLLKYALLNQSYPGSGKQGLERANELVQKLKQLDPKNNLEIVRFMMDEGAFEEGRNLPKLLAECTKTALGLSEEQINNEKQEIKTGLERIYSLPPDDQELRLKAIYSLTLETLNQQDTDNYKPLSRLGTGL